MKNLISGLTALLLLAACTPSPKPIEYGADKCDFCRMTIVDPQHGAELVTSKGKVYKFDAIECMVDYLGTSPETEFALYLVNDYLADGQLVEAEQCTYLISPNMPSPMGANLSAFASAEEAARIQQEQNGQLYNWGSLQAHLMK